MSKVAGKWAGGALVAIVVLMLASCSASTPVEFDPVGEWHHEGPEVEAIAVVEADGDIGFENVPYVALFPPIQGGEVDWTELRSATGTWSEGDVSQLAVAYRQSASQSESITTLTMGEDEHGEYLALSISADKGQDFRFYRE